jgi:uncharacterized membrane protein YecN with MAPEG domain
VEIVPGVEVTVVQVRVEALLQATVVIELVGLLLVVAQVLEAVVVVVAASCPENKAGLCPTQRHFVILPLLMSF